MKNSLLRDTSSESEMEAADSDDSGEKKVNGVHNDGEDNSNSSFEANGLTDSDDSIMEKFLNNKMAEVENNFKGTTEATEDVSSNGQKSDDEADKGISEDLNEDEDDSQADSSNVVEEIEENGDADKSSGARAADKDIEKNKAPATIRLLSTEALNSTVNDREKEASEKPLSQQSDASSTASSTIRKPRAIGRHVFGNLDKDLNIPDLHDSDQSDDEQSNSTKQKSNNNSDCEILDTSMFKNDKAKSMDGNQLSKILSSSSRSKPTTSRAIPEDCISLSSDSDLDIDKGGKAAKDSAAEEDEEEKTTRKARPMLASNQLTGETKRAQKEESDRVKRLEKKNDRLSQIIASQRVESQEEGSVTEVILDYDAKKERNIIVHKDIVKHLKPHQVDGIKFMYDCCYGSVDTLKKFPGSGCILAHCMGLGKTLQVSLS